MMKDNIAFTNCKAYDNREDLKVKLEAIRACLEHVAEVLRSLGGAGSYPQIGPSLSLASLRGVEISNILHDTFDK